MTGEPGPLRRRAAAAWRLPPLDDGTVDPWRRRPLSGPSSFGLTDAELARHARCLCAAGWLRWEIAVRLQRPGHERKTAA